MCVVVVLMIWIHIMCTILIKFESYQNPNREKHYAYTQNYNQN